MGNLQSAVSKQVAASFTNVVNSTVNNVINQADLACSATDSFSLCTGCIPASPSNPTPATCPFSFTNGSFNISQTNALNCTLNSTNITSISNTLKTDLQTNISQWIQQNLNNFQGWLTFAFNTQAGQSTNIQQVSTDISNSITNNISNQCSAELGANTVGVISLCGYFDDVNFNFNQTNTLTSLTSCINKDVINNVESNQVINEMIQQTDQHFASQQQGPLTGAEEDIRVLIIVIAIIAGLLIIGGVIVAIFLL